MSNQAQGGRSLFDGARARGAEVLSELQRFRAAKDRAFLGRQPRFFDPAVVMDVGDFRCLREFLSYGGMQPEINARELYVFGLRVFTK